MENIMCVYRIVNIINGKQYVGSTGNYKVRVRQHRYHLKLGKHHSIKLQRSYAKYGADAFKWEILEIINDISLLLITEQKWIDNLRPELNVLSLAGSARGYKMSESARTKISKALTGIKRSDETKKKCSDANKGRKKSTEARVKLSDSLKSSKIFQDSRKSKDRLKKVMETKKKNGTNKLSDKTKDKISETLKAKHYHSATSKRVQIYDLEGNFVNEFPSVLCAEKELGFPRKTISYHVIQMKRSEFKGYKWLILN